MIIDSLKNLPLYFPTLPLLSEVEKHLSDITGSTINGKYDISDKLFIVVNRYSAVSEEDKPYEVHRRYADLQMILCGRETIFAADTNELKFLSDDFKSGGDNALYENGVNTAKTSVTLVPGNFAVFFPGEAHKPGIDCGEKSDILKVIFKIEM